MTPLGRIVTEPVSPREAMQFFASKGFAPPDRRFDFRDWAGADHAHGFVVAKAMQDDVLRTIRRSLDRAIADGQTLDEFRGALRPELEKLGWWGKSDVQDPVTGEWRNVQLGSDRRLAVIFDTNVRGAYAAGRWTRIQRQKQRFPYLLYQQIQRPTRREDHAPFHDLVLPVDHRFWQTHYPPNGYFCGCIVRQLSEGALRRRGLSVSPDPEIAMRDVPNNRTGQIDRVPRGITPGFAANPGATFLEVADRYERATPGMVPRIRGLERGLAEEARQRGMRDEVEHMAMLDLGRGEVVDWTAGFRKRVALTPHMVRTARDGRRRLALIHNHPTVPSFPLSGGDFRVLQTLDGIEAISAIGHDGSVFRAVKRFRKFDRGDGPIDLDDVIVNAIELGNQLVQDGLIGQDENVHVRALVIGGVLDRTGVIRYSLSPGFAVRQIQTRHADIIEVATDHLSRRLTGGSDR